MSDNTSLTHLTHYYLLLLTAEPGRCSDDWPCPGNNPCIRNECHCPKPNTIGNGQTFCTVPGNEREPQRDPEIIHVLGTNATV